MESFGNLPNPGIKPAFLMVSCIGRWALYLGKRKLFPRTLYPGLATWEAHQFSSVQLCLTLCDPMDCSTPGFPVRHQLPELIQSHIHGVDDAIQPSHPLSTPSPLAFNLSQHQSLFK